MCAVPGVRRGRGRPRKRPCKLHADKAYDDRCCRSECRAGSVRPRIDQKPLPCSSFDQDRIALADRQKNQPIKGWLTTSKESN